MAYEDYKNKVIDELENTAFDYAEDKLREKGQEIAHSTSRELVKFSDVAVEQGYHISYEVAEITLPPNISRGIEEQLRHSTDLLKKKNRDTINYETAALVDSSVTAIMSVAKNEQSFEEASRAIVDQGKTAVQNVIIENVKDVAIQEAQRIGGTVAKQALKKSGLQVLKAGAKGNVAVNALILGDIVKDSVLRLLDGKINEEQFIKEVTKKGTILAVETVGAYVGSFVGQGLIPIPVVGAVISSTVTSIACNCIITVMDATENQIKGLWTASKNQAVADRRKIISKIKTDALTEMERQRTVMKEYFADEKLKWDNNIKEGFELITSGSYSNDVEVIAQGLDRILQNFGSKVAFSNREEFHKDFRKRKIVVNL